MEKEKCSVQEWFLTLDLPMLTNILKPRVVHLFYELAFFIAGSKEQLAYELERIDEHAILAIDLTFEKNDLIPADVLSGIFSEVKPKIETLKHPNFKLYQKSFNKVLEKIKLGHIYQANLTMPFEFKFCFDSKNDQQHVNESGLTKSQKMKKLWAIYAHFLFPKKSIGAYGMLTAIPQLQKAYFSNSPECLFDWNENERELVSRPIKGTIKHAHKENTKQVKLKLIRDKKIESELFMISDLILNDLSKVDRPNAFIKNKKVFLQVPKLLHLYSKLAVKINPQTSLKKVLSVLFPGGSITGAPKLQSMRVLKKIENRERGFYCGSTLLMFNKLKSASINIRSAEIDLETFFVRYQAGGGIVMKSRANNEFVESLNKTKSFTECFKS